MRRALALAILLTIALGTAAATAQDPVPPPVPAPSPPLSTVRADAISAVLDARLPLSRKTLSAAQFEAARNACEALPADDVLLVRYYNLCQGYIDLNEAEQNRRECFAVNSCRRTISLYRKRLRYYLTVATRFNRLLPAEVPAPECAAALGVAAAELKAVKRLDREWAKVVKAIRDENARRADSTIKGIRKIKGVPTDKQLRDRFRAGCR